MQYPQIQFYKGSLVRLANGRLKQVEDLSSDDFIESARLAAREPTGTTTAHQAPLTSSHSNSSFHFDPSGAHSLRHRFNFQTMAGATQSSRIGGSSGTLDENNNSVFNSPEPNSASCDDSPRMETEDYDDEEIDVELDVVSNDEQEKQRVGLDLSKSMQQVSEQLIKSTTQRAAAGQQNDDGDPMANFYLDFTVVRDFLEVGPIQRQQQQQQLRSRASNDLAPTFNSPASSSSSSDGSQAGHDQHAGLFSMASTSSSLYQAAGIPPPMIMPQITATNSTSQTVLIKFYLETSRSIAFIEVPIEQPFFVLHCGWSSWNPQSTYEAFGLKCRKLKIGDTCISLIKRRKRLTNSPNDSDQCNILFSSIKINE